MLLVRIAKESRLSETLQAAQSTDFYRCWLRSLDDDPEHTLDLLPHVDIGHFDEAPDRFRSGRHKRLEAAFIYPIQPAPKISVLAGGFRRAPNLRILSKWTVRDLSHLKTDTVAAPVSILREVAAAGRAFDYPVVAFTGVRHGYLSDADRDFFWRSFRVPVFEQMTGLDNDVIADECEAHDGLHARSSDAIFEFRGKELVVSSLSNLVHPVLRLALGLTGRIEQSLCRCGKPGPRLMDLKPYEKARMLS
jgi:phenylacetate-coenzyme A ligase PaaK-like adenylate-forming protein